MNKEKSPNFGVFGGNIGGPMANFRCPTGIRLNTKESKYIGKTLCFSTPVVRKQKSLSE